MSVPNLNEDCPSASIVQVPTGAPPGLQELPELSQVPAVPGSKTMPFNAIPGLAVPGPNVVFTAVFFGVKEVETAIICAAMVLGFSGLGKVPTAWSGRPFATRER